MKKIIAVLLLLSMLCTAFVACNGNGSEDTTVADNSATIDDAVEYLTSMYKTDEGKKTPAEYKLVAQIPVGEVKFEVTWTVDSELITIVLENGLYSVKLPSKNETEFTYTLTATVKDEAGATVEKTFTRVLPVYDNSAAVTEPEEGEIYKLFMVQANVGKTVFATHATQNDKYIVTTDDPKEGVEFQVEKVEGGIKIYTMIEGVKNYLYAHTVTADDGKISKYISYSPENSSVYTYHSDVNAWFTTCDGTDYVVGTYSSYTTVCISESTYINAENTGVSQFVLAFMTKEAADAFVPSEAPKDPTEITAIKDILAIGEKLEHNTNTVEKYLVKGVITEIKSEQYGNLYIKDEAGDTLYVYGLYSKDGSTRYDAMTEKPAVGDTITVMSQVCNYNGPQLKNATLQKLEKPGSSTPDDGLAAVKPAAGTAYRFAFIQKNVDNKVFYITGILSGYYMDTTETVSKGADVYVEETTGGFYLYCTVNGAKSYINMVQSGNYTNAKFEAAASTVYTYDETLKTVVGTVEGKSFVFGTKADGTYTTLGPVASDSGCMYAQFVAIPEGGENTGSTTEALEAVKPAAGTAYKFGFVQGNANKTLYITGAMNGYYMDTTEDKASAADVYVEETTGGFYLYCMVNGTKTYINMVQSGTHTNGKFEATATTVYTYDETLKTVVGTVEGKTFIFGTRADATYTTIGPMASDSGCFHAVFVK